MPGEVQSIRKCEQQRNNETVPESSKDVASTVQKSLPNQSQTIRSPHANEIPAGNVDGVPGPQDPRDGPEHIDNRAVTETDLLKAEYTEIKEVRIRVFASALRSGVDHLLVNSAA